MSEVNLEKELASLKEYSADHPGSGATSEQLDNLFKFIPELDKVNWGHFTLLPPTPDPRFITEMASWKPTKHQIRWFGSLLERFMKSEAPLWVAPEVGRGYAIDRRFKLLHPIAYQYPATGVESYEQLTLHQQLFLAKDRIVSKMFGWEVTELPNEDHHWYVATSKVLGWSIWLDNYATDGMRSPVKGDAMEEPGVRLTHGYATPDPPNGCLAFTAPMADYLFAMIANNVLEAEGNPTGLKTCRSYAEKINQNTILRKALNRDIPEPLRKYYR